MFQKPKGTRDIYGLKSKSLLKIKDVFFEKAQNFNFEYIETPIFENAELFNRSVGESSDIVNKEMYLFQDRANRLMALRPEGTAPVIRAIVENKLFINQNKFFYFGPMFRYERPQKGRYRQFYQSGVEFISEKNIYNDLEIIQLAKSFLENLNIKDYTLKINNLGSKEDRVKYNEVLKAYFQKYYQQLSDISKTRIEKNPLRILDDKIENEKDFVKNAPKLNDYISPESKKYFDEFCSLLENLDIKYEWDFTLVRGLDYYDDLVFEFVSNSEALGMKSTIIGGGRYNSMFEEFGAPKMSAIGFGVGIERLIDILEYDKYDLLEKENNDFYVATINQEEFFTNLKIVNHLREHNFNIEWNKKIIKISKLFKEAEKNNAKYILFKEKDQTKNYFTIKNLSNNDKKIISLDEIFALKKERYE